MMIHNSSHRNLAGRCSRVAFGLLVVAGMISPRLAEAEPSSPALSLAERVAEVQPGSLTSAEGAHDVQRETSDNLGKGSPQSPRSLDSRASYRALIEKEALGTGLAPAIAEAVMGAESSYDPAAISNAGAIGLMQVLPSTARMLGFTGTDAQLAEPATNIHYGVTYLAQAWRLAGGDLCTAAMKYRAGHGESRFSYLSVSYCHAIRGRLMARGFPVTGTVPVATFGEAGGGACKRRCLGGGSIGRVNFAALNTKLAGIVLQVRATR
jgi:hypothetical protein